MEDLYAFFKGIDPVVAALIATTFTWLLTAAGAALVFFFKTMHRGVLDGMLGFTGGVMVAASFWSLLNPSIEMSEKMYPSMPWMPAAVGFFAGAIFLFFLDKKLPHLHINFSDNETEGIKTQLHQTVLLVLAITLRNFSEGHWNSEFSGRFCCRNAVKKGRGIALEKFLVRTTLCNC